MKTDCATIRLVAMLFFALITGAVAKKIDSSNYFRLINDVRKYYWSPYVIFVRSDYHDLNISTLVHTWSREFSRRDIMIATITFSNLVTEYKNYKQNYIRPLFVVLLDTDRSMSEFVRATRNVQPVSFSAWFVMFLPHPDGNPLEKYCRHPADNVFNVDFGTLMLVLCYDNPILVEWYAIRDNRTRTLELATWDRDKGLIFKTRKNLYTRRNDMFGEVLRVTSVKDSSFFLLKNGKIGGFFGLLLIELSQVMNFTIELLDQVDGYGTWSLQDMVWTDAIGQLVAGEADIGVSEFTLTSSRLHAVDFTFPVITSRTILYFKQPSGYVHWSGYFKAFSIKIWIMLATIIVISSISLTAIKTKGRVSINLIFENYIRVWGIYCQQSLSEFPNESPMRLAFFSIYISSVIILSAYSASIISSLTLTTAALPFSTLDGYVKDGSYKLIVMKTTSEYDMSDHVTDPVLLKMYKLLRKEEHLPSTMLDGFKQVCEQENLAFYTTEVLKNALNIYLQCKLVQIEGGKMDNIAMALTKDNPYTGFINYHLRRFQDNGVLSKLRNKYLLTSNPPKTTYEAVKLQDVALILTVLTFGTLLALFILTIEKAYCTFNIRYKSNKSHITNQNTNIGLNLQKSSVTNFQNFERNYIRPVGYWP